MNFLELAQAVRREAGISGTGPSAVTGQSGEMLRVVEWVNDAWVRIQNLHQNWNWMRRTATIAMTASDGEYEWSEFIDTTSVTNVAYFARWETEFLPKLYKTSLGVSDESDLCWEDYDTFRYLYRRGSIATQTGRPQWFAINPRNSSIQVHSLPDAAYTGTFDYWMAPSRMAANADTPSMPQQFHMLIVYQALMLYGELEAATEVFSKGRNGYNAMIGPLELNQLPLLSVNMTLVR